MRVLVTGAGGFVGHALVPLLASRGYEVVATDRKLGNLGEDRAAETSEGDLCDARFRRAALNGVQAAIHLATVPGGAAEEDPELARRINVEAAMALSAEFAALRPGGTFVFASSVAVFGDPLPPVVDDATPLAPRMLYGAHKAMLETWLAALSRRGELSARSLRLPGIVARPPAPSGMKSAFISDVFHALAQRHSIELPVSAEATMWLMSVRQVAKCLADTLEVEPSELPESRAVTLPALRVHMHDLVAEICRQRDADPALVRYNPLPDLEKGFGRQPPLTTAAAHRLGFSHDGDLSKLVQSALATLN